MNRYLYYYIELLSVLGAGTPDDPGGDFSLYCWIDAESADEALKWGHTLLGDYYRHRFAQTDDTEMYTGAPVVEGEIETDQDTIDDAVNWNLPTCCVVEFPEWDRPWRICNINKTEN